MNYDLPWNPMRVEQRIGRLDRLGQESEKVAIWNLLHEDTIDDRIYERLFVRLGVFERTLGGLEAVLGQPIRELTRDLFLRQLTPDEERARIDQTETALENVRRTEEALETQASSLVAYGDYIVQQVQAARDLSRRIEAADIQRYVLDYLSQNYPGCRLNQDPEDESVVSIELASAAKNDLSAYLRQRRSPAITALTRNDPAPVRCRFENRLRVPSRRDEEIVSQLHPLVRFVAQVAEEKGSVLYPAIAARVEQRLLPVDVPEGDYLVAVMRWSFEALRTTEQLWYGAMRLNSQGEMLEGDVAERFLSELASAGLDWPGAAIAVDCAELAKTAEDKLLRCGQDAFEQHVRRVAAQNDDLADAQLRSLDGHLVHQRGKYADLRRKFLDKGNVGLARVQENNVERVVARVEREKLRIGQRRQLRASFNDVCVGVVRVE